MIYRLTLLICAIFCASSSFSQIYDTAYYELNGLHLGDMRSLDLDNDGDLDLVQIGYDTASVDYYSHVYYNVNDSLVDSTSSTKYDQFAKHNGELQVADFNDNGWLDLTISDGERLKEFYSYENNNASLAPGGVFIGHTNGTDDHRGNPLFMDYDFDGDLDFIIRGGRTDIFDDFDDILIYEKEGDEYHYSEYTGMYGDAHNVRFRTTDFNLNGKKEFIRLKSNEKYNISSIFIFEHKEDPFDFDTENYFHMDSDHHKDFEILNLEDSSLIIAAWNEREFMIVTGSPGSLNRFGLHQTYQPHEEYGWIKYNLAVGDVNNDGFVDLVKADTIFLGNGTMNYSTDRVDVIKTDLQNHFDSELVDLDNDGDLDLVMSGSKYVQNAQGDTVSKGYTYVYENKVAEINLSPQSLTGLNYEVDSAGIMITWDEGIDDKTPGDQLTYSYYLKNKTSGKYLHYPASDLTNGFHKVSVYGELSTAERQYFNRLPPGEYEFGLQAIDASYTGGTFTPMDISVVGYDFVIGENMCQGDTVEIKIIEGDLSDRLEEITWEIEGGMIVSQTDSTAKAVLDSAGSQLVTMNLVWKAGEVEQITKYIQVNESTTGEWIVPEATCDGQAYEIIYRTVDTTEFASDLSGVDLEISTTTNDSTFQVISQGRGQKQLVYTATNEYCSETKTLQLQSNPVPTAELSMDAFCQFDSTEITLTNLEFPNTAFELADTANWEIVEEGDTQVYVKPKSLHVDTISFYMHLGACSTTIGENVIIRNHPSGDLTYNQSMCLGDELLVVFDDTLGTGALIKNASELWLGGKELNDSLLLTTEQTGSIGLNLLIEDQYCFSEASLLINVNDIPQNGFHFAHEDTLLCDELNFVLQDSSLCENCSYYYDFEGAELDTISAGNYELTWDSAGKSELFVALEANGCWSDTMRWSVSRQLDPKATIDLPVLVCAGDTVLGEWKAFPNTTLINYTTEATWDTLINDSTAQFLFEETGVTQWSLNNQGCKTTIDLTTQVYATPNTPQICYVTVDTTTGLNKIIWHSPENVNSEYKVYRKSDSENEYDLIAKVRTNEEYTSYMDSTSNPVDSSYTYSISLTDVCQNTTDLSEPHESTKLTVVSGEISGWSLNWSEYTGVEVESYSIYRGIDSIALEKIDEVSGNVLAYIDQNPPALPKVFYRIMASGESCDLDQIPDKKVKVYSNMVNTDDIISGAVDLNQIGLSVFPNPSNGVLNVVFDQSKKRNEYKVTLLDLKGKTIKVYQNGVQRLDISDISNGQYILRVVGYGKVGQVLILKE